MSCEAQVPIGARPDRLDRALVDHVAPHLPGGLSRRRARALIDQGAVFVDGARVRVASRQVRPGARLEVRLQRSAPGRALALEDDRVLFRDDALLIVDKPAGVPTLATRDDGRDHLLAAAERWLRAAEDGAVAALWPLHRLDVPTSGVVAFARTKAAAATGSAAFRDGAVAKRYVALATPGEAARRPGEAWTVDAAIATRREGRRRWRAVDPAGEPAVTHFSLLAVEPDRWHIEARPETGRMHQIRVHLAHQGAPILGDRRYGGPEVAAGGPVGRALLHAAALTLPHPGSGEPLTVAAPLPPDMAALVTPGT